jgi:hypothetical protein
MFSVYIAWDNYYSSGTYFLGFDQYLVTYLVQHYHI